MTFLFVTQSECLFMMNGKKGGTAIYVVPMVSMGTIFYSPYKRINTTFFQLGVCEKNLCEMPKKIGFSV